MLPPHLPASRKIDRAAPVRSHRGKATTTVGLIPTTSELKGPLRVIGSKSEAAVAAMRKRSARLC
jgi:hypothetical protein